MKRREARYAAERKRVADAELETLTAPPAKAPAVTPETPAPAAAPTQPIRPVKAK